MKNSFKIFMEDLKGVIPKEQIAEIRKHHIETNVTGKINTAEAVELAKNIRDITSVIEDFVAVRNEFDLVRRVLVAHEASDNDSLKLIFGDDAELISEALNSDVKLKSLTSRVQKSNNGTSTEEVVDIDKLEGAFKTAYLTSQSESWQAIRMMVDDGVTQGEAAEAMGFGRVSDVSNTLKRFWPVIELTDGHYSKESKFVSYPPIE